jgi:hypothetical protein
MWTGQLSVLAATLCWPDGVGLLAFWSPAPTRAAPNSLVGRRVECLATLCNVVCLTDLTHSQPGFLVGGPSRTNWLCNMMKPRLPRQSPTLPEQPSPTSRKAGAQWARPPRGCSSASQRQECCWAVQAVTRPFAGQQNIRRPKGQLGMQCGQQVRRPLWPRCSTACVGCHLMSNPHTAADGFGSFESRDAQPKLLGVTPPSEILFEPLTAAERALNSGSCTRARQ